MRDLDHSFFGVRDFGLLTLPELATKLYADILFRDPLPKNPVECLLLNLQSSPYLLAGMPVIPTITKIMEARGDVHLAHRSKIEISPVNVQVDGDNRPVYIEFRVDVIIDNVITESADWASAYSLYRTRGLIHSFNEAHKKHAIALA